MADNELSNQTWWSRESGGTEVLRISLPLVVSSLSWTVMTFMDRMMLKWESGAAMSAAFNANNLWFVVLCLPLGICMYCAAFVSQYFGNDQPRRIGPAVWQGVWVAALISPLLMLSIPLAPMIFAQAGHGSEIENLESTYFQILCFGIPGLLTAQAFSAFYAGRGKTGVVMCVDTFCAIVNLVLDYLWIFGYGGFPAMGISGAAWATVTALTLKAAIYMVLITRKAHREQYATGTIRLEWSLLRRLLFFGAPSGFQILVEVAGFTIFVMLVSGLGSVEAEATTMAFSVSTLAFMPIWGFAQATTILVGQRLGEDREDLASRATWTTLWIALSYMSLISALYLVTPDAFLFGFFSGSEPSQHQDQVRSLAIRLLQFVAAYNLLDAVLMIFVSAIKGAGDTRFVLAVSAIMASVLVACSWLGVEVWNFGVQECWAIITLWVWILGLTFFCRFQQGKWRSMRVIEPAFDDAK